MPFIRASKDFKTRLAPWGTEELSNKLDRFVSPSKIRNDITDGTIPEDGIIRQGRIYKIKPRAALDYAIKIGAIPGTGSTEEI